jgi:dihydroorotase-like cyclic amidohydrolase
MTNCLIRGGSIVTPGGVEEFDLAIGRDLPGEASEIDARGLHIFPAVIDTHADPTLIDLSQQHTLRAEDLFQRHRLSPYAGSTFRASIKRTIRRGETIFVDGKITANAGGKLVRPEDQPCST